MSDAKTASGAATAGWEKGLFSLMTATAVAQEENPGAAQEETETAQDEVYVASEGEIAEEAADAAPEEAEAEGEMVALVDGETVGEEQEVILTRTEQIIAALKESSDIPLWGVVSLLVLVAALVAAIIALLVANGRLQEKAKAARPGARGTPVSRPVTQVRVGKLHAQGARRYQEDCFGVSDATLLQSHGLLAVVADGMGGLSDGDKVSFTAVETALNGFVSTQGMGTPEQILLTLTHQIVQNVNGMLGPDGYRKSGCTLAMGLVKGDQFSFVSIGDSHVYLLRGGVLTLLSREHDYKTELAVRSVNGEMELSQVYANEQGGALVSYVGMGNVKAVDMPVEPLTVFPGDRFILTSDGVYNALTAQELEGALCGEAEAAAARLGELIEAKAYSAQDNYTAVILECN